MRRLSFLVLLLPKTKQETKIDWRCLIISSLEKKKNVQKQVAGSLIRLKLCWQQYRNRQLLLLPIQQALLAAATTWL